MSWQFSGRDPSLRKAKFAVAIAACSLLVSAFTARGATLVGAKYAGSVGLPVAPGQVVRLEVAGLHSVLPANGRLQKALTVPLPATLAGISVQVSQASPVGRRTYDAAILSVEQVSLCADQSDSSPDCYLTYVTVEIPTDIVFLLGPTPGAEITISEAASMSSVFGAGVISDNIHVITSCDKGIPGPCRSVVTHADGSPVSAQASATPGEVVIIYAWGLGQTVPSVPTGTATSIPAPKLSTAGWGGVGVHFDFGPNLAQSGRPASFDIVDAYLTPNQVALYQVNVRVPEAFAGTKPCDGSAVLSNAAITILGPYTFDTAQICVATR